ncbi:MAG: hypothetical protein M3O71_00465 [Bacteroidota bacterium]|nr:hypothetical protein [Bacteroidota bacterium]
MRTLNSTMRSMTTKDLRSLPVIDLTDEELTVRLGTITEKVIENTWAKNSYLTYYDDLLCPDTTHSIHEYRDRKELVKLKNGKSHLVKIL